MSCRARICFGFIIAAFATNASHAGNEELLGTWDIDTYGFAVNGSTSYVSLAIEEDGDEVVAHAYNGPVVIRVVDDGFEFDLHWRTGWDTDHTSTFSAKIIAPGKIEGVVDHNGAIGFLGNAMKGGEFTGSRIVVRSVSADRAPEPFDMSGVWNRGSGQWLINQIDFALTPNGKATMENYKEMDNANSRCGSMGVVMAASMPYPMEIVPADDYIVIVYGADYVRRIYLDGREFPDSAASSSLGFSMGEWQGDTLVVKTNHLNRAFMSARGHPVSSNAHTIEHFFMDDKGYLHVDMWVHDPENYTRAPYYPRVMDRNFSPSVITKVGCDPYSFFRALYLEGELEEFWDRAALRR